MRLIIICLFPLFITGAEAAPRLVNFLVENQNPQAGDTISVTVGSNNRSGIAGGQLTLIFPSPMLTLIGEPSLDSSFQGFDLVHNVNNPGELQISFANDRGLEDVGAGALFSFQLLTHESGWGEAQIEFTEAHLFDEQGISLGVAASPLTIDIQPTPLELQPPKAMKIYHFHNSLLEKSGWLEMAGGFTDLSSGEVVPLTLPEERLSSSLDRKGLKIDVDANEVVFLYAENSISNVSGTVMMQMNLQAENSHAGIWLVGMKGNVKENQGLDGSMGYYHQANSETMVEKEKKIQVIFPVQEKWTPVIQILGKEDETTIWIDRIEIWKLDDNFFGVTN